jgi:signal transduction histidine kinase
MRRFGCLFLFVALFAVAVGTAGVWAVATATGILESTPTARAVSVVGIFAGLVLVLAIGRLARRLASPAADLVAAAGRIEEGDLSVRVPERGPRELRSLARAFNSMTTRLEADEAGRRSFLADVTHEMRTPIAVVQGQLEAILDGVYPADAEHLEPALAEARSLERLVDDLRTLALLEAGRLSLDRQPVDPATLTAETVAAHRGAFDAAGIHLRLDVATGLPVVGADRDRIRRAIANLLVNAHRHTPRGGNVLVRVAAEGDAVRFTVEDSGVGIPPELLPTVFDRFVKGDASSGTGLGLAIARDLVEAHGGTIVAANLASGGAAITFTLPAATRDSSRMA